MVSSAKPGAGGVAFTTVDECLSEVIEQQVCMPGGRRLGILTFARVVPLGRGQDQPRRA